MAAREPLPLQAVPYEWNDAEPPPAETLNQWGEVGNGIDKSQTGTPLTGLYRAYRCGSHNWSLVACIRAALRGGNQNVLQQTGCF